MIENLTMYNQLVEIRNKVAVGATISNAEATIVIQFLDEVGNALLGMKAKYEPGPEVKNAVQDS